MSFLARKAFWREVLESGSSSTINTRTIFPSTRRLNWRPTFLSSLLSVDRSPATQESLSQRHRCLDRSRESPRPRKGASIVLAHSGDLAPSLLGAFLQRYCELLSPASLPLAETKFRSILLRGSKPRRGKSHFRRAIAAQRGQFANALQVGLPNAFSPRRGSRRQTSILHRG